MMRSMTAPKDAVALKRLAMLVMKRRLELGLDKIDVARKAGITITTYGQVEAGASVRDSSYGKLEPALGWAPGSCLDVLAGADSASLITEHVGPAVTSPLMDEDLAEGIGSAFQDAAIHVSDSLTSADIRAMKVKAIELLRERGILPPARES